MNGDILPRHTRRLVLRRFAARDLAAFQAYRHDPDVGRWQGWTPQDDVHAAAFIAEMADAPFGVPGEWLQIAVADRATDALLGDIGVGFARDRPGAAEVGFSLAPAAQHRGLGTEAVRAALDLLFAAGAVDVVEGVTDARNAPSIRLLERVGMRRVRTQQAPFRGGTATEHVYAIARAAWAADAAATSTSRR